MTTIAQVQNVTPTNISHAAALSPTNESASMLPLPAMSMSDPMSMIYLFESKDQQLGLQQGDSKVKTQESKADNAFQKELKAIAAADEAAKHKSFWDSLGDAFSQIAKVAGVVASIAAAVATCGAASPLAAVAIAGAVMSTAGFIDGETGLLKSLGVDASVAGGIDLGLSLGGAAASLGSAVAAAGTAASSTAGTIGKVAGGVSALTTVAHGVTIVASGMSQRDEDEAFANAASAEADQSSLRRRVQQIISQLQDSNQQDGQMLQTIAGVKQTQEQTGLIAATALKG